MITTLKIAAIKQNKPIYIGAGYVQKCEKYSDVQK